MKPLLQHLENESLLLLYMAGELPPADRAEVESLLVRDGGLRAQLQALRAAESSSFAAFAQLDAAEPLQAAEPAMRRLSRSMQQWQIDRLARPAKKAASRSMPVWAWSSGSAVAALLVFCIWWGFHSQPIGKEQVAGTRPAGNQQLAGTQPNNEPATGGDVIADGSPVAPVSPTPAASDSSDSASSNPNSMQIVTVDSTTQRLGELESMVSEDLSTVNVGD